MTTAIEAWDAQQKRLIKDQIAPKATDDELRLFAQVCQRTGLDPFQKQIYAIHRNVKENGNWVAKMTIQVAIDGFRVIAERSREFEGATPAEWCGADGKWVDVWLSSEPPAAARIGVWRTGFREPLVRTALWSEYVQTDKQGATTGQWRTMPALMLAKCAEALALRAAFPNDLSGLYTNDEMGQADNDRGAGAGTRKGAERKVNQGEPRPAELPVSTPAPTVVIDGHSGEMVNPDTGEIIDAEVVDEPQTLLQAGLRATEQRRSFAPPTRRAQPEPVDATEYADPDAVIALQQRITKLDGFVKDDLVVMWKDAELPSVAKTGARLTPEQLRLAGELIDMAEAKNGGAAA